MLFERRCLERERGREREREGERERERLAALRERKGFERSSVDRWREVFSKERLLDNI